ncbi:MAG TPA: dienelactone hydrolase family protein [Gemmatimonadaceae bacterium]|jgi:putative phosphoribosyl transferase|nr:dienelactone hydrolase family protein [Gemmatimonadaceae bacterium]
MTTPGRDIELHIPAGDVNLEGSLAVPESATGLVIFVHGSGSSRQSPRNTLVARELEQAGLATLLVDLLTPEEAEADARTGHLRFDIDLLAERVGAVTDWLATAPEAASLGIGYFGASTGAAAALQAASTRGDRVKAIVSRGGRPDLALECLPKVRAPTLLIVGEQDVPVLPLNREAYAALKGERELAIVPGAGHLFEEPGALESVARLARKWFERHLIAAPEHSA